LTVKSFLLFAALFLYSARFFTKAKALTVKFFLLTGARFFYTKTTKAKAFLFCYLPPYFYTAPFFLLKIKL
jgi:hypothetical protein